MVCQMFWQITSCYLEGVEFPCSFSLGLLYFTVLYCTVYCTSIYMTHPLYLFVTHCTVA